MGWKFLDALPLRQPKRWHRRQLLSQRQRQRTRQPLNPLDAQNGGKKCSPLNSPPCPENHFILPFFLASRTPYSQRVEKSL